MHNRGYYTLVTSLPHLPRFDRAERLPITRERLKQRLQMLDPEDYKLVEKIAEFITSSRQPLGRTHDEMVSIYRQGVKKILESPLLKPLFELSINQKTILTALRRRLKGLPAPHHGEIWDAGPLVPHIEHNWDMPFFKLRYHYPWIVQAQTYLQGGEMLPLDYLLFNLVWDNLDHLLFKNYFGFEVVIAYLLKWDILQQWLSYNRELAKTKFEKLVMGTIHEYEQHSNRSR